MAKALFITATGTDVGKTYVSALICKRMKDEGFNIGYYKAALSGSSDIKDSDAWYVKRKANLEDEYNEMVSYTYKHAYSPHLAAQIEGNPTDMKVIKKAYKDISKKRYINFRGLVVFHELYKNETFMYYILNFIIMNLPLIGRPLFKIRYFVKHMVKSK